MDRVRHGGQGDRKKYNRHTWRSVDYSCSSTSGADDADANNYSCNFANNFDKIIGWCRMALLIDCNSDTETIRLRYEVLLPPQIHFLLCNTCYWCASDIGKFTKCPSCNSLQVESMPIAKNELYKFDHNPKGGVTLEFSNAIKF